MDELINVMQDALQVFLIAVIPAVAAYLASMAKAWIDLKKADFAHRSPKLEDALELAVELAVKAAEQLGLSGAIDDKLDYAVSVAQTWLDSNGWDEVDVVLIEAAVESAVYAKFNAPDPDRMYDKL